MSALQACNLIHGNAFYSAINPLASAFENATVVPKQQFVLFDNDLAWGVYDKNGANIPIATYRRGPDQYRVGQSEKMSVTPIKKIDTSSCTFVYVGPIFMHYGHFLLTSMARLWPFLKFEDRNLKLIYHGDYDIETVCQHMPVAAAALKALNLTPENFFRPMEPTRFSLLHVPAPSFEETNSAHRVHGDVGAAVGRSLPRTAAPRSFLNPVVFSKTQLTAGVSRIVNEDDVVERLSRKGVEVVYPEKLSLAEQVDVFDRAPAVISYAGSALHTSLLASKSAAIVGLQINAGASSSQILIDFLRGNDSSYFYPTGQLDASINPAFAQDFRIDDPVGVAEDILRAVDAKVGWRARARRLVRRPDRMHGLAYPGVQSLWP